MRKLDPTLLSTFVTVTETGSFTAAGDRLGFTQSAISMHIRRLEEALGVPVLERNARAVRMTPAGETLLDYARRMLELQDEALRRFHSEVLTGRVRVGTCDDFASALLPQVLTDFTRRYPQVRVEIVADTAVGLTATLERGELDLAFVLGMPGDDIGHFVREERLVWVTAQDRPAHKRRPLPLALFHEGCAHRRHAIGALQDANIDYTIVATSISKLGIDATVRSGMGVSAIAESGVLPGMRVLTPGDGLPELPSCAVFLVQSGASSGARVTDSLARHLVDVIGTPEETARVGSGEEPPFPRSGCPESM